MGKLTSLILGVIAIDALSYYVLSSYYTTIINWFGPILGYKMVMFFGFLFLFFGNPLQFTVLIIVWIIVGLVVALGSRRGLRSVGAASSLFFLTLGFFILLIFSFFEGSLLNGSSGTILSSTTSFSLSAFPPPPPGSSLSQVLTAPVISALVSLFEPLFSGVTTGSGLSSSSPNFTSISGLASLFTPLITAFIENLVILLVSAGIFGAIIGRVAGGGGKKISRSEKKGKEKVITILIILLMVASIFALYAPLSPVTKSTQTFVSGTGDLDNLNYITSLESTAVDASLPSLTSTIPAYPSELVIPSIQNSIAGYYEGIVSYVSQIGSIYNAYGFALASNSTPGASYFQSQYIDSSIFTTLIGTSNLPAFLLGDSSINVTSSTFTQVSNFLNLVPQEILAFMYPGNLNATSSVASSEVAYVDSAMGEAFTQVLALALSLGTQGTVSLYVYTSGSPFGSFIGAFENSSVNNFYGSGLINVFSEKLSSGSFNTGAGNNSGSLLFSAFLNFQKLKSISSSFSTIGNFTNGSAYLSIIGGATVSNYAVHSSGSMKNITLSQTLGYSSPIKFASGSAASILGLGAPTKSRVNSSILGGINFTGFIQGKSLTNLTGKSLNFSRVLQYNSTTGVDPGSVYMEVNWTFPANINVMLSTWDRGNGIVQVNTTLINNDSSPVYNLSLNESGILKYYGSYITNVSGKLDLYYPEIHSGQSVKSSFSFKPTGTGDYVLWNMTMSYLEPSGSGSANKTISVVMPPYVIYAPPPFFLVAYNEAEYSTLSTTSHLFNIPFVSSQLLPGFYGFDLIIALIVLLDVYIEIRAFRKYRRNRESGQK